MNQPLNSTDYLSMRRIVALVIFLLTLLPSAWFAWQNRDLVQLGRYHDDSIYWSMAQSLAQGGGYRIQSLPGEPAQTKYPPGYPWLLSWIWRAWPSPAQNHPAASLFCWLMLPVYLLLVRATFARFGFSFGLSWLMTAWIGLNTMTVVLSMSVMSDLPFAALVLAVALWLEREQPSRRDGLWAGIVGGASFFIRSAALPLLLTAPACLWWRKRRREAVQFAAGMALPVGGWLAWSRVHLAPGGGSELLYYTSYTGFHFAHVNLGNALALLWFNLDGYLTGAGQLLVFYIHEDFFIKLVFRLITIACVLGVVRLVRSTGRVQYAAFGVGLSVILLLWTYAPSPRFLFPLFPLFVAGFVSEMQHLFGMIQANWRKPKREDRAAAAVVGLLACSLFVFAGHSVYEGVSRLIPDMMRSQNDWVSHRTDVFRWIRENTPEGSTFVAYDDVILHMQTGRHSMSFMVPPKVLTADSNRSLRMQQQAFPALMRRYGLQYALWTEVDYARDWPDAHTVKKALDASRELERIYVTSRAAVYILKQP